MTNNLAANTPVKYSLKLVELLYNETIYTKVTNTDYEGTISKEGDRVTVRTLGKLTLSPYTKQMTLVAQNLTPVSEQLIIDQQYYFKFEVDDIDALQNDVDTINEYARTSKRDMSELLDNDILTYMVQNIDGDNAEGTAYATGTVAVAVTTGVVTGTGTTFTAKMVGGYFKAVGHSSHYIVVDYTSATVIKVADVGTVTGSTGTYGTDLELTGGSYSGGALTAGKAFNINAATAVAVSKSNIYAKIVALRTALGKKLTPKAGRFLVVNSEFEGILLQAPEFIPAVGKAYEDAVLGARIGGIAGFDVYCSELVFGDNTSGFYFLAGTRDYCAFALQIMKVNVIASSTNADSFVDTVKGLLVWGRKVFDGNRGRGAFLRATLS